MKTDEGRGEWRRGSMAEQLPAPVIRNPGVSALAMGDNNTAAMKESKRRILDLESLIPPLQAEKQCLLSPIADDKTVPSAARQALSGILDALAAQARDVTHNDIT